MVYSRNTRRSHVNPPRMQNQQSDVDSRPPEGALETIHDNINEMEALHLTNQRLLKELEQLAKEMQRPQEVQQAREGHHVTPQEELQHLDPPQGEGGKGEASRAREQEPYLPPKEGRNEGTHEGNNRGNEPIPHQQGMEERSWEQRFRGIQR